VFLMLNVILGAFNLLPLPPLDGGSVFSIFLPENVGGKLRELQGNGSFSIIGLLVAWRVFPYLTIRSSPRCSNSCTRAPPTSDRSFFKQWAKPGPVPARATQRWTCRMTNRSMPERPLPHFPAQSRPPFSRPTTC
jgi:hypothetical protein